MKRLGLFLVFLLTIGIVVSAQGYRIGDIASDFELKDVNGKIVSLSNFSDVKGYIIIFTCDTCSQFEAYNDRIVFINDKYSAQGYPVIAVYPNHEEKIRGQLKGKNITFPCLIDHEQKVFSLYGVTEMPQGFLLQKTSKGNIVRYAGSIYNSVGNQTNRNYFLDAADTMLMEDGIEIIPSIIKPDDHEIKIKRESGPELVD